VRGGRAATRSLAHAPSFGGGAVVMATGVVSLCFHTSGPPWLSRSLFAVAAVVSAVLMLIVIGRALTDRHRWADEADAASSLTLAAGTAVLGGRLATARRTGLATALLAAGTLLWAILLPPVLRRRPIAAAGTDLLACVVPQSRTRRTPRTGDPPAVGAVRRVRPPPDPHRRGRPARSPGRSSGRASLPLGSPAETRSRGLRNIGTKTDAKPSLALVGR
jgi:hypothetical protein